MWAYISNFKYQSYVVLNILITYTVQDDSVQEFVHVMYVW